MYSGDASSWCLIESDPGVFTELVEAVGVEGVEFQEMLGVDDDSFAALADQHTVRKLELLGEPSGDGHPAEAETPQIFGFVFLFKWANTSKARTASGRSNSRGGAKPTPTEPPPDLYFAKQMIPNACATQAILSVLLNKKDEVPSLGQHLEDLRDFSRSLDPTMRGLAISNSERLMEVHNSFRARGVLSDLFDDEEANKNKRNRKKEDAFHYLSLIPFRKHVYELDGLQEGPVERGEFSNFSQFLEIVGKEIRQKIEDIQRSGNEIRFSLLAVVGNKLRRLGNLMEKYRLLRFRCEVKMLSLGVDRSIVDDEVYDEHPELMDELPNEIPKLEEVGRASFND
eukprot:GHVU01149173.1.p1 GENE.GHVU01149173.1~~GHVU01149173.1.p1  ORF type:complete len:341 (+),score=82.89 GHVU01149173.1:769-1791(+)